MLDVHALDDAEIKAIADDPDTVRRILAAAKLLTMQQVGERLGISYYRVKILRGKRTRLEDEGFGGYLPRPDALPQSLPLPGDPVWHPEEINTWGRQTGRLSMDGTPQHARPTGRPKRPRTA